MQAAATLAQKPKLAHNNEYIPGVCNIGPAERFRRRLNGIISGIAAVVLLVFLVSIDVPAVWRLLLIIPVSAAASGFLQDAMHFCAGFGMKGIYNVINSAGITEDVQLEEFRRKDRTKALQIAAYSLVIGAVIAASTLFI